MFSDTEDFVTTRLLDAPRELLFDAWTQKAHLDKWFGPIGCQMVTSDMDLRVGGTYHYGMRTQDGTVMWGKWTFREIKRPERLVLISSFSDEKGDITVHPWSPDWPRHTLSTTTFETQGNRTLITLRWAPYEATEVECSTFAAGKSSMDQGWSGTFEQLVTYLKQAQK
jgi:uncharacterized protein YndB with AHSA1/START domain